MEERKVTITMEGGVLKTILWNEQGNIIQEASYELETEELDMMSDVVNWLRDGKVNG